MGYEINVGFNDDVADVVTSETYHKVLDKHDALGIGHERTQTSTMLISSEEPLNLEQLAIDLEDIPILSVRKVAPV